MTKRFLSALVVISLYTASAFCSDAPQEKQLPATTINATTFKTVWTRVKQEWFSLKKESPTPFWLARWAILLCYGLPVARDFCSDSWFMTYNFACGNTPAAWNNLYNVVKNALIFFEIDFGSRALHVAGGAVKRLKNAATAL